jgi:hypothetical protein
MGIRNVVDFQVIHVTFKLIIYNLCCIPVIFLSDTRIGINVFLVELTIVTVDKVIRFVYVNLNNGFGSVLYSSGNLRPGV